MSEKLDEWDDPTLSELTQRVILKRRPTTMVVFEDEVELERSLTDSDQMLGGELLIKVHGAKVSHNLCSCPQELCILDLGSGQGHQSTVQ